MPVLWLPSWLLEIFYIHILHLVLKYEANRAQFQKTDPTFNLQPCVIGVYAKKHAFTHAHSHTCTYSGPIHFTLLWSEVKLPPGRLTVGPPQCDMLGCRRGGVWGQRPRVIGKDANTDNMVTCRKVQGTCKTLCKHRNVTLYACFYTFCLMLALLLASERILQDVCFC